MNKKFRILGFAILLVVLALKLSIAQTNLPLLEEYNFQLGDSAGTELLFHDQRFGNGGSAQFRIHLIPDRQDIRLRLEVFRHHTSGISFALLLERVEIQFFNASGALAKSLVLDQVLGENGLFIIGDSSDGYFKFERKITGMTVVRALRIRAFGNYE